MSVVVYIELSEGIAKKGVLEAASFASKLAEQNGEDVLGVAAGSVSDEVKSKLEQYGVSKILSGSLSETEQNHLSAAASVQKALEGQTVSSIVLSNSWQGKGLGPVLAVKLGMGIVTEVVDLPQGNTVKKKGFSNKAFVNVELQKDKNIFAITPNAFGLHEKTVSAEQSSYDAVASDKVTHVSYDRETDGIPLPDAEIVVSAGRGLKGPENWGMIEELASVLKAGTACSKPVSDAGWRPHSEHVGQTGITISPKLYFAIGISGAIQHLAGVSSSKKIVAINTDPEAPFFKAADYGIVGDAFEVVPKLIEAVKKIK
jgi:electron transfer flavoprotein alpha subunit